MSKQLINALIVTFVIFSPKVLTVLAKDCTQNDLCSCTFDDGGVVDISSLGNTDNSPRFQDVKGTKDGNVYSYNPCKPFTEKTCKEAAACVQDPSMSQSVQIGDSSKAAFKYDEESKNVVVGYTSGTLADLRLTQVIFVCDEAATDPEFVADGELQNGEFQYTVTTACACPGGCSATGPNNINKGISGGSIILIAFFAMVLLYIVLGVVVQKFVMKKGGKEVIPNSTFWFGIPSNIKAGTFFVLGLCIPRFRATKFDAI